MFISIRIIKKLNLDFLKKYTIYQRYHNIPRYVFSKTRIFISRGLFDVYYFNNIYNKNYKYGMFSFTRKPFSRPVKRLKIKKR